MRHKVIVMIERLRKVAIWIDDRVYLSKIFTATAGHTVPRTSGSWFYVFGSGTLLCFMASSITFKMDRDRLALALLLGLRSVQLVGQPTLNSDVGNRLLRLRDYC